MFKEIFESDKADKNRPKINSSRDAKEFLRSLYVDDAPEYEDNLHIIKSFKKIPSFMRNMKFSKGKFGSVIGQEKSGLKRKFLFEIEDNFLNVYVQTKKVQRQKDFEFFKEYHLDELF
jgi:hypothetical protein